MIDVTPDGSQELLITVGTGETRGPLSQLSELGVEPMANIANLVDVMLVLACGLMLAIVTFWQIQLPDVTQVLKQREMTEISDVEDVTDRIEQAGSSYNELGIVFEDSETGKMYLIQNDAATESEGEGTEGDEGEGA